MVLKSYAKINLTLSVNKKLKSGLHNIQSIYCLIDLHDKIFLKKIKNKNFDQVSFTGPFSKDIKKSFPIPETIDYDEIKLIIDDKLNQGMKEKIKYQFICDENERWIYRCNRMTGEIECFSMSSNKLRLLSSTR